MIGRWISAMAASAAAIPSLTATETRRLVAELRDRWSVGEFLGNDHRGVVEPLIGYDPVDDVPAFQGGGRVAPAEQRHLLGPGRASLREPLHCAHQGVQADGDLDRADLGRLGRHDEVASQRELEAAPDADSCDAGDDGRRVLVERLQRPDEIPVQDVGFVRIGDHRVEVGAR